MILTAHIPTEDLTFFNELRTSHFPASRNYLDAHVTMFHNVADRHLTAIRQHLASVAATSPSTTLTITGVRHLGRGVAFEVESPALKAIRGMLVRRFESWLVAQDLQGWRPHITIQNSVAKAKADELFETVSASFAPRTLTVSGIDLWHYLGGPWRLEETFEFGMR